jgi:iron(III) transport system ATP-binding protein
MVFQSYALWPHKTVAQNVAFGLDTRHIKNPERDRRIHEALSLVQMDQYKDRRPNQLSGGQQQRVALARALAIRPRGLLLDEPLSNLDAKLRADMRTEIRNIVKAAGITAVYVTHDQKEALAIADYIALLQHGTLQQLGTPAQLYLQPANRFVADFIGQSNFIPGTIQSVTPASIIVKTPAGLFHASPPPASSPSPHSSLTSPVPSSDLPPSALAPSLSPGTPVTLAIRPEFLFLSPSSPSSSPPLNRFSARLLSSTYLGDTIEHLISLPGLPPLKALQIASQPSPIPPDVILHIPPDHIILLSDTPD